MPELRRMWPLLGTYVEAGAIAEQAVAEAALAAALDSLRDAQRRWSFHDPDSELSRLNHCVGRWLELPAVTLRLLRLAKGMGTASGGLFNCTVGGTLVSLGALPDHTGQPRLDIGNAEDLELQAASARLRRPVRLTLDGIAKGYAVDLAVGAMRRAGAAGGWVNAGGDMRVFGEALRPVERREADGRRTSLGALQRGALASSRTGGEPDPDLPGLMVGAAARHPVVWSVLAPTAWRADALTKVAANEIPARRADTVRRLGGHLLDLSEQRLAA